MHNFQNNILEGAIRAYDTWYVKIGLFCTGFTLWKMASRLSETPIAEIFHNLFTWYDKYIGFPLLISLDFLLYIFHSPWIITQLVADLIFAYILFGIVLARAQLVYSVFANFLRAVRGPFAEVVRNRSIEAIIDSAFSFMSAFILMLIISSTTIVSWPILFLVYLSKPHWYFRREIGLGTTIERCAKAKIEAAPTSVNYRYIGDYRIITFAYFLGVSASFSVLFFINGLLARAPQ